MTAPLHANSDALEDLARRSATPVELVKSLYEDEVTKLKVDARIEKYIPVIATQRVTRTLRRQRRDAG